MNTNSLPLHVRPFPPTCSRIFLPMIPLCARLVSLLVFDKIVSN